MTNEWNPPEELRSEEELILKLCKKQKLWGFLRKHRQELLDEEVRAELAAMYRPSGRGPQPVAPERLALAMLLQVAFGVADHEVPTLTAVDRRWQMILDCLGVSEPAFSQGSVFNFRERAREHGFMRRLLDKTVELARQTKGFSHKRLRTMFDSSPLLGAGRVEDTFNLLGRAISKLVEVAATEAEMEVEVLAEQLKLSVVTANSVKAALDVDWREPEARTQALGELLAQFARVEQWLQEQFDAAALVSPPLKERIELVERIIEQDTEPEPDPPTSSTVEGGAGSALSPRRMRRGSAPDRLVSVSDPDMRYGRKSKSKVFPGYKRHVAVDADVQGLICEVEVVAANQREHDAAAPLMARLEERGFELVELHIDRGYLPAEAVVARRSNGLQVISKPPAPRRGERYSKSDFDVDFEAGVVRCPAGVCIPYKPAKTISFPSKTCRECSQRSACVTDTNTRGRQLTLHPQEQWYRAMADELATPHGRALRRQRIPVEHTLARIGMIQGTKATFNGRDKNQFDLERAAVVNNCYVLNALFEVAQAA